MRKKLTFCAVAALLGSLALVQGGVAAAQSPGMTRALPVPSSAFDHLKSLVGEWQGSGTEGPFRSSIRLVSNGTALEETFQTPKDDQMVSLYAPDGNRLAMTHFCSVGNQPRMETEAVSASDKDYVFAYAGITNLSSPSAGHMQALTIHIDDANHFSEQWTYRENGKDLVSQFRFERKKA